MIDTSKNIIESMDTERLTNFDKRSFKLDMFSSRCNKETDVLSPEFNKYTNNMQPLSNIDENNNCGMYQDTPGFKNFQSNLQSEIYKQADKENDPYILQVKNELISDFNSTLSNLCSLKARDRMFKKPDSTAFNSIVPTSVSQKYLNTEASYSTNTMSLFSKKEKSTNFREKVESIRDINSESHSEKSSSMFVESKSAHLNLAQKHELTDISSISRQTYNTSVHRGILDPSINHGANQLATADGHITGTSNRFRSLVNDIRIEDNMFSLGARPL